MKTEFAKWILKADFRGANHGWEASKIMSFEFIKAIEGKRIIIMVVEVGVVV